MKYVIAVILAMLLIGCTKTEPATQLPTQPATVPQAPPVTETVTEPSAPQAAAPAGADVTFNGKAGFDPATITIKAGATINVLVKTTTNSDSDFSFRVIGGAISKGLLDGQTGQLTFEEPGTYTVLSVPFSKRLEVKVE